MHGTLEGRYKLSIYCALTKMGLIDCCLSLTCFDLRYYFKCFPNHSGPSLKRRPMRNGTSGFVGVSSREGDIKCEYRAGGGGTSHEGGLIYRLGGFHHLDL